MSDTAGNLVSFTLDPATGQVVKVETLDSNGGRREVSDQEKASLAQQGRERLEEVLEEAFEAGIDCVLGGGEDQSENDQSTQDAEIRHVLVAPLIQRSPVNRLWRREVLGRAIVGTLIQQSIQTGSTTQGEVPQ
jgi:hypothetical protein